MSDRRLNQARAQLEAERSWDDVREQRVLSGALQAFRAGRDAKVPPRRAPDRRRALAMALAAALVTAMVTVTLSVRTAGRSAVAAGAPSPAAVASFAAASPPPPQPQASARILALADGSHVTYGPDARLEIAEASADRVRVRQLRGEAAYAVEHLPDRIFVVQAADVSVRVRGTRFTVELEDEWVAVRVEEGHVEVDDGEHVTHLFARDTARVRAWRAHDAPPAEPRDEAKAVAPTPAVAASSGPVATPITTPRAAGGPLTVHATGGAELDAMLADANEARARGDLGEASRRLRALLTHRPDRTRESVALFALGRVERARGDAAAAAGAFLRCHRAATSAALAEDALAEAAEAYAAAGADRAARDEARAYLERYPEGTHAARMRALTR